MQNPQEYFGIVETKIDIDNPISLDLLLYDIDDIKGSFNERLDLFCKEHNMPYNNPIENKEIEICGIWKILCRRCIKNPNYEKELAVYNSWKEAEDKKKQLEKEAAEAKEDYKKAARRARVNCHEIAKIIASNKSAIEKQQEIQEQLTRNTIL